MAVMGPDHRLCAIAAMRKKRLERFEHVPVAQVPALGRAAVHGTVIAFGGANDPGVLHGVEPALAVLLEIVEPGREHCAQLFHRTILAPWQPFQPDVPTVMGGFVLPRRQAAIALPPNFPPLP